MTHIRTPSLRQSTLATGALAIGIIGAAVLPAGAQTPLDTVRVASGLAFPIYVTHAPNDFHRIFILEKQGRVRIVRDGTLLPMPFLDIDALVTGGTTINSEQGLLGLAFHPNYASNGYFYVNYTGAGGTLTIARYHVSADPDVAETTAQIISQVAHPGFTNHNGGWIEFGPDGYMYVSLGDGGSACDPNQQAQSLNIDLGKLLRIDVDGPDNIPGNADDDAYAADSTRNYSIPIGNPFAGAIPGLDEIWAYGLRNPWRPSFDALTGDLYIADVGQNNWEEIDFQPAGSPGGLNYGWDCREGRHCAVESAECIGMPVGCTCGGTGFVEPIHEYSHSSGCSITGGYVYRGCAIPDLQGTYFFADFCSNTIWSFRYTGSPNPSVTVRTAELAPGGGLSITSITSFGEDAYHEMYICDQNGGEIFKIVPQSVVAPDCDGNGQRDACQILADPTLDANHNGQLDSCEPGACCIPGNPCQVMTRSLCLAAGGTFNGGGTPCQPSTCAGPCPCDWNGSGNLDSQDYFDFLNSFFGAGADFNQDGLSNSQDFFDFLTCFFDGC